MNFFLPNFRLSRRSFGCIASMQAALLGAWNQSISFLGAQNPKQQPLNRYPRMVQEYFVAKMKGIEKEMIARLGALKTKSDAESYVKTVREKIARCFGPFPEKTPLKPRITGKVERDTYFIEKVIFESRPGFQVTANLYVPKGKNFPLPGVVGSCGHSANGKAAEAYQSFAQALGRMGYVTLIFDPIGQGERSQYSHLDEKSRPRIGVGEHLHGGNQQFLVGEFFGSWRAWDGIRALDYLLTRKEVDPKRVGITGNSGGGTMSTWLCGVENRWTMAAPSCFVTTFRRNLENELPADTEQCPPGILAEGVDHSDFLAALAPKPVIILAKEKDFFDVRGAEEAFARLKRLYTLLGAEKNIGLFVGPTAHGYSQENREAMYRWFNHAAGVENSGQEPKLVIEKDETLWCAPGGSVASLGSRTVFSFTREKALTLAKERSRLKGEELKAVVAKTLQIKPKGESPDFRILRPVSGRNYPLLAASVYAVETEPGLFAVVYRLGKERLDSRPSLSDNPALLYVADQSTDLEFREDFWARELIGANKDAVVYGLDVRGIGESRPDTCGINQFLLPYGSDYFYAIHSLMMGAPYLGGKTHDVLQVINWLGSFGHKEVRLAAKGWGTLCATFAALYSPKISQITLKDSMDSFQSVAVSETYQWPLSTFLPGVLKQFDLPDCYSELGKKLKREKAK